MIGFGVLFFKNWKGTEVGKKVFSFHHPITRTLITQSASLLTLVDPSVNSRLYMHGAVSFHGTF